MTTDAIDLDARRGMEAQKATEIRRRLHEVEADQMALRHRREELEAALVAVAATSWSEAAEKARYLLQLFALTSEAQDPRRRTLIASVLADFTRLAGTE
jgi:hypothetical protein